MAGIKKLKFINSSAVNRITFSLIRKCICVDLYLKSFKYGKIFYVRNQLGTSKHSEF
jgi:hypothetical protein